MLVKIDDEWADPAMVECVFELDADETGPGGTTHFRGESGFVRFDAADGRAVLVNSRAVAALRADREWTEVETFRGLKISVEGRPDWVAAVLNGARRRVA